MSPGELDRVQINCAQVQITYIIILYLYLIVLIPHSFSFIMYFSYERTVFSILLFTSLLIRSFRTGSLIKFYFRSNVALYNKSDFYKNEFARTIALNYAIRSTKCTILLSEAKCLHRFYQSLYIMVLRRFIEHNSTLEN